MNEKNGMHKEALDKIIAFEKSEIEMKGLISKLEEDISKGSSNKSNEEDILSAVPSSPHIARSKNSSSSLGLNNSEDVLQVVINQRDRFKQRIIELEAVINVFLFHY
jgi:hypothetical protein